MRTRQNHDESDLARALAGDKQLQDAKLYGAVLFGANLERADLRKAGLAYANLSAANLNGADLTRADLYNAKLNGTTFFGAYLRDVQYGADTFWPEHVRDVLRVWRGDKNLRGAQLRYANLRGANLNGADLRAADLYLAELSGADLTGADLTGADLFDVYYDDSTTWPDSVRDVLRVWRGDKNLRDANLRGAYLRAADLFLAELSGADLTRAILTDADLTGAQLPGAKLIDVDLTGADLTGAKLTGAILDGISYSTETTWPKGFKPPQKKRHLKRAYGAMTGPVLKFGKPEVAYRAQDFKRRYPQEFDLLKRKTGVTDFSPQFAENLRQTNITPFDWIVTHGRRTDLGQRVCFDPNFVLLLNIDLDDEQFTEQQKKTLRRLAKTSRDDNHPHEQDPLFTVGWVRICRDDANRVWLVEEIQSDVQVVRDQKNGKRLASVRRRPDKSMDIMQPYVDRFYQDALGITLIEAEKLGYEVEMLTYQTKRNMGINPPSDVYTDLPLSMGISAKRKSKARPDLPEEVRWTRPNPRNRR